MKEACSTRVPEDSYPPPSSPESRKLPAVFPGAFLPILPILPILPRSCFFRRHQKGFFFPFFLPVAPPRGAWRSAPGPVRCPALPGSVHLRQEGKPRGGDGTQRRREGSDLRGVPGRQSPAQEVSDRTKVRRRPGVGPVPVLPLPRDTGSRHSALRSQVGRGGPRLWRGPPPQKQRRKEGREGPDPYAPPAMHRGLKHSLNLTFFLAQKVTIIIVKPHKETKRAETYSNLKFLFAGQGKNVCAFLFNRSF